MEKSCTFASAIEKQTRIRNAQMAESVDALVSNTSGFTSIPVRPRVWVRKPKDSFKRANIKMFAQMAESVDALVSNTSGFTSIPVRPRVWVHEGESFKTFSFFYICSQE